MNWWTTSWNFMVARKETKRPLAAGAPPCGDHVHDRPCACRRAVTRAYYEMRASVATRAEAMDAAVRVYNYHHPGFPPAEAIAIIRRWLEPNALH